MTTTVTRLALALGVALGASACPGGARGDGPAAPADPAPREGTRTMRFLALGDSYTIGEAVPAAERWPVLLAARLRAAGVDLGEPEVVARTGWTTDELDRAIDEAAPRGPYDLVSLLVGVNDQYRGRPLAETRPRFAALVRRAVAFAGDRPGRVLVLSVPDWGVTPFCRAQGRDGAAVGREIDALDAMEREEAARAGVAWLDITPISREAATDAALLASDGLHPSGAMYARWAAAAEPLARAALGR